MRGVTYDDIYYPETNRLLWYAGGSDASMHAHRCMCVVLCVCVCWQEHAEK